MFYIFAAVAVGASILVIAQRNPIHSVLLLIASFGALSGLYVLLDAPFVAVIQIIVYAGAIMVLFLFVVMLLNAPVEETDTTRPCTRCCGPARCVSARHSPSRCSSNSCGRSRKGAESPACFPAARSARSERSADRSSPTMRSRSR